MKIGLSIIGALAGALLSSCQSVPRPAPVQALLAITNVTVIDPENRRVLPAQSVYISGDTVVGVRPASEGGYVATRTVDGTGKFVIPGLFDMHVHLFLPEPARPTLNLLLANGVTSIREMSSDCWEIAGAKRGCIRDYRMLQSAIRSGELPGPEILGLTSTMVMGPSRLKLSESTPKFVTPRSADEGRAVISYIRGRGVDLVKTHDSIPAEAFAAMMEEARGAGLAVGGHVPFAAGSLGAAGMGYKSIEHARDLLYDCSRFGPEFRKREAAVADGTPDAKRPPNLERLRRTIDEFDADICRAFLVELAKTGVYYVPTHVTREMEARAREPGYRSDPQRKYILAKRNSDWESDLSETVKLPDAEAAALADFFRHGLRITGLAHQAGIPIMAGTDSSDTMIVPGFSLHRELLLLRAAGLSNMDVLRSATTIPATYFGKLDRLGGIAAGKEADILLLDRNPLDNIANTAAIAAVVSNGRLYDRGALDGLLAEAEAYACASAR
jgi:imidazolonepropionase-like amidohydrolase